MREIGSLPEASGSFAPSLPNGRQNTTDPQFFASDNQARPWRICLLPAESISSSSARTLPCFCSATSVIPFRRSSPRCVGVHARTLSSRGAKYPLFLNHSHPAHITTFLLFPSSSHSLVPRRRRISPCTPRTPLRNMRTWPWCLTLPP